jgi:hypothetical protein
MTVPEWQESKIAVNRHPAGRGLTSISWLLSIIFLTTPCNEYTHTGGQLELDHDIEGKVLTIIIHNQPSFMVVKRTNRSLSVPSHQAMPSVDVTYLHHHHPPHRHPDPQPESHVPSCPLAIYHLRRGKDILVEEQGIILVRIGDQPSHGPLDIRLGRNCFRILGIVGEHDDILRLVPESFYHSAGVLPPSGVAPGEQELNPTYRRETA